MVEEPLKGAFIVTKLEGEGKRVIKREAERWDLEVRWLPVMTVKRVVSKSVWG